jgi:glucose-6-phosphate 1-dehydrogenase
MLLAPIDLTFKYADAFKMVPNVGYETLIYDCLIGDPTLFQRADMIEASWAAVDPALVNPGAPELYEAGSAGPAGADALLARSGHSWRAMEA